MLTVVSHTSNPLKTQSKCTEQLDSGIHKDGRGNTRPIPLSRPVPPKDSDLIPDVSVHLDYLTIRGTLPVLYGECRTVIDDSDPSSNTVLGLPVRFSELLDFISSWCSMKNDVTIIMDKAWSPNGSVTTYQNTVRGAVGIIGGYSLKDKGENREVEYTVRLSGEYFQTLSIVNQWRLLQGLSTAYSCHCSRIDLAIDDRSKKLIPYADMRGAVGEGNYIGFKKAYEYNTIIPDKKGQFCHYYGSRESGKMWRVYDKPEIGAIRLEAEFKREYAHIVYCILANIERDDKPECIYRLSLDYWESKEVEKKELVNWFESVERDKGAVLEGKEFEQMYQQVIATLAVTCFDFRDKSSRKDRSKASRKDTKRCEFWQTFLEKLSAIDFVHRTSRGNQCLEKTMNWLKRQVSATVAILTNNLSAKDYAEFMSQLRKSGTKKINEWHKLLGNLIADNPHEVIRLVG